ncbi:MAG: GTP-binding protein [Cellvibrionaceae bacterium]|nr:GTP-binding protein [Cellvibrionaceae bacterium]
MSTTAQPISAVATNIVTGFLGVGKTSAILNLLKSKPSDQRWAVLVNEFGEIGIDGSLFSGSHRESEGIFIREVPGGCMCCAAGLPMQIALNQLLSRAKPERLLIEPTGLGHPREVLEVLAGEHYKTALSLQKIVTLVDARQLSQKRYTEHATFNQQLAIADIIVGNKRDLYSDNDRQQLQNYLNQSDNQAAQIVFAEHGCIAPHLLEGSTKSNVGKSVHSHHPKAQSPIASDEMLPECGYLKAENQGEGFFSVGWRISPHKVFNRAALYQWLSGLDVERAKGVFITAEGIFAYNVTPDTTTEMELDDCLESSIEIIGRSKNLACDNDLFKCISSDTASQ